LELVKHIMHSLLEFSVVFFVIVGGFFVLIGSFGLVKLPDLMSRLHGPSKATTLGVGGCLIASMIHFGTIEGRLSIQEILITFFLFITAPVTAHFIAKAHLHTQLRDADKRRDADQLPDATGRHGWSTFEKLKRTHPILKDRSDISP
jgi:multicomponent K+:H+ antiporter subunit G